MIELNGIMTEEEAVYYVQSIERLDAFVKNWPQVSPLVSAFRASIDFDIPAGTKGVEELIEADATYILPDQIVDQLDSTLVYRASDKDLEKMEAYLSRAMAMTEFDEVRLAPIKDYIWGFLSAVRVAQKARRDLNFSSAHTGRHWA